MADFYAILKATEHLERAFTSGSIGQEEYTRECNALIGQFKVSERALISAQVINSTTEFIQQYKLDVPRAQERLLESGVPATTIYQTTSDQGAGAAIAETTQTIITLMDAMRLDQRAVDDIHPLLSDVMNSITKVPELPNEFPGLAKVQHWLKVLNDMRAADEIDDDQARQLVFDLESLYGSFMHWLKSKKEGSGSRK